MKNKPSYSITKPCSADWGKMKPCASGRHCGSCDKTVIDFTNMTNAQIEDYFFQNRNKNICGRFYKKQLGIQKSKVQIFFIKLYSRTYINVKSYIPRIIVLLLLGTFLNLMGCGTPNSNENAESERLAWEQNEVAMGICKDK